jgi:Na+/H+-dicarboxylate symporter
LEKVENIKLRSLKVIPIYIQILAAIFIGGLFGYIFPLATGYTNWCGDLFLRALNMITIPLITCSIISGVSNIGSSGNLGRLGLKTLSFYLLTTLLAILTGLIFVRLIKPGVGVDISLTSTVSDLAPAGSIGDTLLNIVPTNFFKALADGNMLSIIFFAILFGFFMTKIESGSKKNISDFIDAALKVIMKITMFIIRFTPLGVFSITAKIISEQVILENDLKVLIGRLGLYFITVLIGLLVHMFITLPLIVRFIGKSNPIKHFKNMATPLLTAFSTSSSNATLPISMETVEENDGVSNKITGFTMPLGATINMDGTALYECVAVIFIAQAYGIDLSIAQQITVVVTALLAAIGAAGIPMAGLVMMTVVLNAVGLPLEGIGLILAVDRVLDMFRTATNVYGDTCCAVVIAKSEGEELLV